MGATCSAERERPTIKPQLDDFVDHKPSTSFYYDAKKGFRDPGDTKEDDHSERDDSSVYVMGEENYVSDLSHEDSASETSVSSMNFNDTDDEAEEFSGDDGPSSAGNASPKASATEPSSPKSILPFSFGDDDEPEAKSEPENKNFSSFSLLGGSKSTDKPRAQDAARKTTKSTLLQLLPLFDEVLDGLPINPREYVEGSAKYRTRLTSALRQITLQRVDTRLRVSASHWQLQEQQECIVLPAKAFKDVGDQPEETALGVLMQEAESQLVGHHGDDGEMREQAFRDQEARFVQARKERQLMLGRVEKRTKTEEDRPQDWESEQQKYETVQNGFRDYTTKKSILSGVTYYTAKAGQVRKGVSKDIAMEIARARRQRVLVQELDRRVLIKLDVEDARRAEAKDATVEVDESLQHVEAYLQ